MFDRRIAAAFLAGVLSIVSVGGLAGPAGASPAATPPNVNILPKPARWDPTKISVVAASSCATPNYNWSITNKTPKSHVIEYTIGSSSTKHLLKALPAGDEFQVCTTGPVGATATFYIDGSKSTLSFTLVAP